MKIITVILAALVVANPICKFDRNELGPQGWWWDVYKCSDGTERRQLVASPRG